MRIFFVLVLLGSVLLPLHAGAAGLVPCGGPGEPACGFCDLFALGENIWTFVMVTIVPLTAAVLLVLGGVFILTSAGDAQRLSRGKSIATSVIVGLLIVYAAWLFVNTFLTVLGVAEWTGLGSWWQIQCHA